MPDLWATICCKEGSLSSISFCGGIHLRHSLACRGYGQWATIVWGTLQLEEKLLETLEKR